jgi:RNA polymerase sigma-70 factor, ECF subfamily
LCIVFTKQKKEQETIKMKIFDGNVKSSSIDQSIKLDNIEFEKYFKQLYTELCRYCIRFVRIPEIAEEIVQEQFIYIWEKRNDITFHTSIKSYLYTSVKHKSIDYIRSSYAQTRYLQDDCCVEIESPFNPVSALEDQELTEIITDAVSKLPERCAIIFSMKRFGDMSNKQIADALNISEKTVENQITIAFKKLRSVLSKCLLIAGLIFLS